VGDWSAERTRALAARIGSRGLTVANVNANTSRGLDPQADPAGPGITLIDPDPARRARQQAYLLAVVDFCHAIGAHTMSLTSGPGFPGQDPEAALALFRQALLALVEHARSLDVRIGIEYEPGFLVGDLPTLLGALQGMAPEWLGANWDVGHAWVVGDDLAQCVEALGPRLFHLHVEDIRGRVHHHLPIGEGDVDFPALRQALTRAGYGGFLTVELYTFAHAPDEAGRRSLARLRELFARG
jgi:sugar phosphate isomerase/epimerase